MVGPRGASGASPGARPGSAPGPPGVCLWGYVRVRRGRSRDVPGVFLGTPAGVLFGPGFQPLPARRAGPGDVRPRGAPAAYDRARPGRVRPGGSGRSTTRAAPTGTDRTRFGPRTTRPGLGPNWTDQGGTGRGRTGRAASRTTESPPRRAPRVRPRGPAPMHDLRGLDPRTTAGVRPRARPCGVRAAYDREGRPRWATCSGRAACDPREARTAHHRAGLGPCTTVRGSNCARPRGARTVHHRPGFGACASRAAFARIRPHRVLDPVRPRRSAPCGIARVRPRADRADPGRVRPCEAPAAYGPGVFRLCSTVWGLPRVRPRAGLRPRTT